jgi:hypothetical protein
MFFLPLDSECGRAKLGASSTVPPQAGPLSLLAWRGLERESTTDTTQRALLSVVGGMFGR